MRFYRATVDGITQVDMHSSITEHVDCKTWEAFAKSPVVARQLLVDALEKRLAGALQSWEMCRDKLEKAKALDALKAA